MNSYEKVHGILKSFKLDTFMPFMVNGEEITMENLLEHIYGVIREEYEHGISDGYEKGYKDGLRAVHEDPGFMPPM